MEDPQTLPGSARGLEWRIGAYILFRMLLALLFLAFAASALILERGELVAERHHFELVALIFLMMGLSAVGLRKTKSLTRFSYLQHAADTAIVSALVAETGALRSPFVVLYFMTIVASAYLVFSRGALLIAGLNTVAFLFVTWLHFEVKLAGQQPFGYDAYTQLLTVNFGFFLVAILSGQLAEKLKETGKALDQEKQRGRKLQDELSQIAETIQGGLIVTGELGEIRYCNQLAEQLFPAIIERPVWDLIPGLSNKETVWEELIPAAPGKLQLLLGKAHLESGGMIITFQDITQLRQMERKILREERLSAVGRLAAGIAHEIRNPLTSLYGAIQLLEVNEDNDPLLQIIRREVQRLNTLVSDFLDASSPRSIVRTPHHLSQLVREVVDSFGHDPRYRENIALELELQEEFGSILIDGEQLRQVLWNLILNAAQAMPEGGAIRISLADSSEEICLQVADEGMGIAEEEIGHIFDPFYTRRSGGTGLGLARVERVVNEHGGSIEVRSVPGSGTQFALTLPRTAPTPA